MNTTNEEKLEKQVGQSFHFSFQAWYRINGSAKHVLICWSDVLVWAAGGTPPFVMPSVSAMVGHGKMCRESVLTGKTTNSRGGRTYRGLTSLRNLKALPWRTWDSQGLKVLSCSKSFDTQMVKANWPCSTDSLSTQGQMANLLCLSGGKDLSAPGPETEWYMLLHLIFEICLHLATCMSHSHLAVDFGCLILVQAAKCTCGISSGTWGCQKCRMNWIDGQGKTV